MKKHQTPVIVFLPYSVKVFKIIFSFRKTRLTYIGVDFLLIKQNFEGAKCFYEVWLNLIRLFQSGILPPNSDQDQKKDLRRILVLSQSGISDFLLPKKRGGQTYFAPFSVRPEGALLPRLPEIDASANISSKNNFQRKYFTCASGICNCREWIIKPSFFNAILYRFTNRKHCCQVRIICNLNRYYLTTTQSFPNPATSTKNYNLSSKITYTST